MDPNSKLAAKLDAVKAEIEEKRVGTNKRPMRVVIIGGALHIRVEHPAGVPLIYTVNRVDGD